MADRVTITLTDLHCEAQSEAGGCEPYLFTSFYSIDGDQVDVQTPAHHDVRSAFANDVEAGQTLPVPQEIGTASVHAANGARIGVVALVLEEDLGRDVAVDKAHSAFHAEVENQLKNCGDRIDQDALREAVLQKVRGAVHGTYDYSDLHRDQDDHLGLAVQEIGDAGEFELRLGYDDDRFILRGRADHA
ncbi:MULTISPECIES: hypothetical protein [Sphingomonas]|uniref:hypothetical protein n=1 Tax=Sphingomonas TaxID=13687 RepID=UPI000DEFA73B|nr:MULTISPECIES: hypothetical protein [Sphingomonas]